MGTDDLPSLFVQLLREQVKAAVTEALAGALPAQQPAPALLTSDELAQQIQVSRSKLDELVRAGLPYLRVGSTRRFELPAVLSWLRSQTDDEAAA